MKILPAAIITTTICIIIFTTMLFSFTSIRFASAAGTPPTAVSRRRGALYGALIADALSLSTHYEYDAKKIKRFYGKIDKFMAPGEKTGGQTHGVGWGARNFHDGNGNGPAKKAGELTDYGDYNLVTLSAVAEKVKRENIPAGTPLAKALTIDEIIPVWKNKLRTWRSWMCTQTRQTLQQVNQGVPSNRLGGNSNAPGLRQAALFSAYEDETALVQSARNAMFTHRNEEAHQANEFWTRVVARIIAKGMTPREAIISARDDPSSSQFIKSKVNQAINKVKEATDEASSLSKEEFVDDLSLTSMARLWEVGKSEPIKVGKASPAEGTLPGAIYFILKYENDFERAASANAEVGGDCASRAIALGMVLGAAGGEESLPKSWREGLVDAPETEKLLSTLPLVSSTTKNADL